MSIVLKHIKFGEVRPPCEVQLVLADGATEDESEVWISARFSLGKRDTDKLPLLAREALLELQTLIDQGMAYVERAPGAPTQ